MAEDGGNPTIDQSQYVNTLDQHILIQILRENGKWFCRSNSKIVEIKEKNSRNHIDSTKLA
jgi:hypothetical protein